MPGVWVVELKPSPPFASRLERAKKLQEQKEKEILEKQQQQQQQPEPVPTGENLLV